MSYLATLFFNQSTYSNKAQLSSNFTFFIIILERHAPEEVNENEPSTKCSKMANEAQPQEIDQCDAGLSRAEAGVQTASTLIDMATQTCRATTSSVRSNR